MSIELKIKAKYLALESGIIRKEEQKLKKQIQYLKRKQRPTDELYARLRSISDHRRKDVRNAARSTHLARIYLQGRPYTDAEKKRDPSNEWAFQHLIIPKMISMLNKYGPKDQTATDAKLQQWAKL